MKSTLILLSFIISLSSCVQSNFESINFLEGIWKVENKDQYEVWNKTEAGIFEGYVYKIKDDIKTITETLSISIINREIVYKATVPNQNRGATVPFTLNKTIKDSLSFENLTHDFPKRIIYKKLNEAEIQVYVLGENNQGFGYKMVRQ
jgi:hypothetical protein